MGRKAFTDRKCHSLSAQRGCHSQNKSPPRPPAPRAISIQPGPRRGPAGLGLGFRITHSTAFDGKVGRQRDPGGALGETGKQGARVLTTSLLSKLMEEDKLENAGRLKGIGLRFCDPFRPATWDSSFLATTFSSYLLCFLCVSTLPQPTNILQAPFSCSSLI